MGGKIKIIKDEVYPPEVRTAAERFEYLGKRLFAADPKALKSKLAEEKAEREAANPGPNRKRGRRPNPNPKP